MIGDRLDNDIRPARLRGWKTIRVAQGFAAGLLGRAPSDREQSHRRDACANRALTRECCITRHSGKWSARPVAIAARAAFGAQGPSDTHSQMVGSPS
jgi:hypothetical protein